MTHNERRISWIQEGLIGLGGNIILHKKLRVSLISKSISRNGIELLFIQLARGTCFISTSVCPVLSFASCTSQKDADITERVFINVQSLY